MKLPMVFFGMLWAILFLKNENGGRENAKNISC